MGILSEHRGSNDLFRFYREGFDLVGKDPSPGYIRLFTCRSTPRPFFSTFAHRLSKDRADARAHSRKRKWAFFCTILVQSKSFRCNTSGPPPMCCKQRTCGTPKSFICNTYKKHRGWGAALLRRSDLQSFQSVSELSLFFS